jgi:hypothetical protein
MESEVVERDQRRQPFEQSRCSGYERLDVHRIGSVEVARGTLRERDTRDVSVETILGDGDGHARAKAIGQHGSERGLAAA